MAANVVAGYLLIRALLRGSDLVRPGEEGGFGLYLGVSFLAGLGMFFGFLFLIVPGIVLWVR